LRRQDKPLYCLVEPGGIEPPTFFGFLIDKPLGEITPWIIEQWRVDSRKAGKTATAINRSVASLRAALSKALDWGLLDIHPLAKLKPIRTDNNGKVRTYPPTKKSGSGQPWISGKPASVKNGRAPMNGAKIAVIPFCLHCGTGLLLTISSQWYCSHLTRAYGAVSCSRSHGEMSASIPRR